MAEEAKVQEQPIVNPYDDDNPSFNSPPVVTQEETKKDEAAVIPAAVVTEVKKEEFDIVDADVHLKTTLGFDTWEAAKTEIESLRKLKETAQTKEEIKFINEQSKLLFEAIKDGKDDVVYEILDTKRKLSAVDKLASSEVLKLHIEQTNKHFKSQDVEDVFEEKYAYPAKPMQADIESEEDFSARLSLWEQAKSKIDRRIERDAVAAKAELSKLNTELTLPDISKGTDPKAAAEAEQKELQRIEAIRGEYLKVLDSDYTKFNGYEVKYKDKEVEIPIAYGVGEDQRVALKNELENFDVDSFISSMWFNKDGSPNITRTMEDVYLLRNRNEIFQKIANDAGAKRLEHHLKTKSNIAINNQSDKTFVPDGDKTDQQAMSEFFWNQS